MVYQEESSTTQASNDKSKAGADSTSHEQGKNEALSELLQHALDLMLPCLIWQPELLLKEIYDFEHLEKLLVRALTQCSDESARRAVERTFRLICTHKLQRNRGTQGSVMQDGTTG